MTIAEATKRFNRSNSTIRNWIKSGKLAANRVGRRYAVAEESVRHLLGIQRSLSAMRQLQAETKRAGAPALPYSAILERLESRDEHLRKDNQ